MFGLNPYVILGVLLTFLAGSGAAYVKGYRDADRSAEISTLRKEAAALDAELLYVKAQARAAREVADAAVARQAKAEADAASMEAEIEEYARIVAEQKDCTCGFTAADIERLRRIGSATRRGAPDPAGRPLVLHPAPGGLPPGRGEQ